MTLFLQVVVFTDDRGTVETGLLLRFIGKISESEAQHTRWSSPWHSKAQHKRSASEKRAVLVVLSD